MSKELKAFNNICCNTNQSYPDFQKQRKIVETALKDYERRLKLAKEYKDVNNVAKRLKAFEIIKKKGLSVNDIAFIRNGESWETYVETMKQLYWGDEHLDRVLKTQEEYDLLKEVLL